LRATHSRISESMTRVAAVLADDEIESLKRGESGLHA
jgi:hypothetical protein